MAKHSRSTGRKATQIIRPGQKKRGTAGEIRIIGGDWRGRKLPVLDAEGLRPTSDRVRETLFNWLQFEIAGAHCLDLFAGSGALSFEALSRGAASAILLELDVNNAQQLKQNLHAVMANNAQVIQTDSLLWLGRSPEKIFDVVFIDPPFHKALMQPAVDALFLQSYINDQAWLYLEQEKSLDWPSLPEGWICHREKSTSQVKFGLFKKSEQA